MTTQEEGLRPQVPAGSEDAGSTSRSGEGGVEWSRDMLMGACDAALDDCQPLSDADIKVIARALQARLSPDVLGALQSENAQHVNAIECLKQERNELLLALIWCKPRLRHDAYQQHVSWIISKYPKPPRPEEPPIVRSGDGTLQDTCRP